MVASIFRANPVIENGFCKIPFGNLICKTVLKPNCTFKQGLSKMGSIVIMRCKLRKLLWFLCSGQILTETGCTHNLLKIAEAKMYILMSTL